METIYVKASKIPKQNLDTLTPNKLYEVMNQEYFEDGNFSFYFFDDKGEKRYASQQKSSHLDYNDWQVIKTKSENGYPFIHLKTEEQIELKDLEYGLFLLNSFVFFKHRNGSITLIESASEDCKLEPNTKIYPLKEI